MRHLRVLALLAPALLVPAACEESGSSSGGLVAPEAGPGIDVPLADGAPPPVADAAVDTFVPPKGVSVTVVDGAQPKANVRVLLHDATGAITSEAKTNATGKVTAPIAPSMITVLISGSFGSVAPITFTSVADGDNLVVAIPAVSVIEEVPFATYNVAFDFANPLITNAPSFGVYVGECFGQSSSARVPAQVGVYSSCVHSPNAAVATATDANGAVAAFGFMRNLAKPAAMSTVDLGPLAFAAPGSTKVSATNLPTGASTSSSGRLLTIANGVQFELGFPTGTLAVGGLTFPTATGFADAYESIVSARTQNTASQSETGFLRREATTAPASATLATFDFANALPTITNVTLAKPLPARPDVTITSAASLAAADGGFVSINWSVPANETSGSWLFVVAPNTTSFKVPALPADAPEFVPAANVDVGSALFFDATQLKGYQDVKALPVSGSSGVDLLNQTKPLPTAGTLRITRWGGGPS